ncbi:MAG: porin [Alphaproteobacteria bacterium]|nr:porin [Alphaproteobacteria bacterium]
MMKQYRTAIYGLIFLFGVSITPTQLQAQIDLSLGGYFWSAFYILDGDKTLAEKSSSNIVEVNDMQLQEDAEIYFEAKTILDSGVEIGVEVQLEAATQSNQIDAHYLYIKGDWGKLVIGAEDSAAEALQTHAPRFLGWKTYDNRWKTWNRLSEYQDPLHDNIADKANKLTYFTPRTNGLQVGLSFTPDNENPDGYGTTLTSVANAEQQDIISVGLNYKYKDDNMSMQTSLTGEQGDAGGRGAQERSEYAIGLSVTSGKFTLGGNYIDREIKSEINTDRTDIDAVHVGLGYQLTPSTMIGIGYHDQENKVTGGATDSQTEIFMLGGHTRLARGVKFTYSLEQVDYASNDPDKVPGETTLAGIALLLDF